ncbi:MAG TPA: CaiB/BaiF CoA-transferase family protein [Burkholderiales bacterium]|nr:CaiB/BaiF CoA-transferase family protein [Burkholderiales bacterium]
MAERPGARAKPLAGVRVLDLTRLLPGAMATLHLADMGADVVKIEDTEAGDYSRSMGRVRDGMSDSFRLLNRNKRAMRLDLKQARGRDAFLRLARRADVVVESFRPGVVARLGVGYDAVSALNPRIVYCSISGYGQDGPYAQRAGHDINYIGYAGIGDQIGTRDGPVVPNFQIADLLGGALVPAMGILAALLDARSSGRGRYVDASMTDAALAHAVFPLLGLLERGKSPARGTGMLDGGLPCYNVYRTKDGHFLAVGALERKFWSNLCDVLGAPDLKDKHLVYGADAEPVKARLAAVFATRTRKDWIEALAGADCCISPVLTIDEALADEQLRARKMIVDGGEFAQFALPLKFSEFEFKIEQNAPAPGEHTGEILREAGFGDAEIAAMRNEGVI